MTLEQAEVKNKVPASEQKESGWPPTLALPNPLRALFEEQMMWQESTDPEDVIARLPDGALQQYVHQRIKDYDETMPSAEDRLRFARDEVNRALEIFKNARFEGFTTKSWKRHHVRETVRQAFRERGEDAMDLLNQTVCVSIDVNGLKAFNDLSNKVTGDKYLQRVADNLKEASEELKSNELLEIKEIILSAEGGDEFGLLIKFDHQPEQSKLLEIQDVLKRATQLDCSDLLLNEVIKDKAGIERVPDKFAFFSSAGIGIERMGNLIHTKETRERIVAEVKSKLEHNKNEPDPKKRHKIYIDDMYVDMIMNAADHLMEIDKDDEKSFMKELGENGDEWARVTYEVLLRNKETRVLYDDLKKCLRENKSGGNNVYK